MWHRSPVRFTSRPAPNARFCLFASPVSHATFIALCQPLMRLRSAECDRQQGDSKAASSTKLLTKVSQRQTFRGPNTSRLLEVDQQREQTARSPTRRQEQWVALILMLFPCFQSAANSNCCRFGNVAHVSKQFKAFF